MNFTIFRVVMNGQGALRPEICCSFETTLLFNCSHYQLVATIRFVTNLVKCSCSDVRANDSKVHHRAHRQWRTQEFCLGGFNKFS